MMAASEILMAGRIQIQIEISQRASVSVSVARDRNCNCNPGIIHGPISVCDEGPCW